MEKAHILAEFEKIKVEYADAKQFSDGQERKLRFDLESSLNELKFEKAQSAQVIFFFNFKCCIL